MKKLIQNCGHESFLQFVADTSGRDQNVLVLRSSILKSSQDLIILSILKSRSNHSQIANDFAFICLPLFFQTLRQSYTQYFFRKIKNINVEIVFVSKPRRFIYSLSTLSATDLYFFVLNFSECRKCLPPRPFRTFYLADNTLLVYKKRV